LWHGASEALPITSGRVNKLSQQFGRQKVCTKAPVVGTGKCWGKRDGATRSKERNSLVNEPK